MLDIKKYVENYEYLTPDNQLRVAEAIINELKDNEEFLYDSEYDKKKSESIKKGLNLLIKNIKKKEELKELSKTFKNFNRLSEKNKENAIEEIVNILNKYNNIQIQENKEATCRREGHLFSNWKKKTHTESVSVWDSGLRGYIDVKKTEWNRTCNRCGCIQTVTKEPEEVKEARQAKAKAAKRKRLKKQLSELENE